MNQRQTKFRNVSLSLEDLVGAEYIEAASQASAYLSGRSCQEFQSMAREKVDFYPEALHHRMTTLLPEIGSAPGSTIGTSATGATSEAFRKNSSHSLAPVSGLGYLRICEDGQLRLSAKSEHYHAPLGHGFPGYRLVEYAKKIGVPNATHNNTRGHITRLLEKTLVKAAGLGKNERCEKTLDRVLNLETGSLAVEAAVKMLLARFYRPENGSPSPVYEERIPVFVVIGSDDGDLQANYHGTTVLTQLMRGMWPEFLKKSETGEMLLVRNVRPNRVDELDRVFRDYNDGPYKIAGFFHELIMMNYGARRLSEDFIKHAYDSCREHDVPVVVDEIQTCVWSPEMYMYREYGLAPDVVVVGKGFPNGEYAASRILFTSEVDNLPQFGALVTNGQEELASLAYLVTMRWVEVNAQVTSSIGEYFFERIEVFASDHREIISGVDGKRHLLGIGFHDVSQGKTFAARLNEAGIDISVQTYKSECPPSALMKLPLTAGYEVVDFIVERMQLAIQGI